MVQNFGAYAEKVKPALDGAFEETLSTLIDEVSPTFPAAGRDLLSGGKKIRGVLCCMVAEGLGGNLSQALPRAVAVELIHTASLIHDDFIDGHTRRRNRPALWTLEGARRAVLLGDLLFSSSIRLMAELGAPDCRVAAQTIALLSMGAWQEPANPEEFLSAKGKGRPAKTFYDRIIKLKTGELFGAACQLGAVAAGADPVAQEGWRTFGLSVGEAYQIADDIQEIEAVLDAGSVSKAQAAALIPALIYLNGDAPTASLINFGDFSGELNGEICEALYRTLELMRADRDLRLNRAAAEADRLTGSDHPGTFLSQAPRQLVKLFDEAG